MWNKSECDATVKVFEVVPISTYRISKCSQHSTYNTERERERFPPHLFHFKNWHEFTLFLPSVALLMQKFSHSLHMHYTQPSIKSMDKLCSSNVSLARIFPFQRHTATFSLTMGISVQICVQFQSCFLCADLRNGRTKTRQFNVQKMLLEEGNRMKTTDEILGKQKF